MYVASEQIGNIFKDWMLNKHYYKRITEWTAPLLMRKGDLTIVPSNRYPPSSKIVAYVSKYFFNDESSFNLIL